MKSDAGAAYDVGETGDDIGLDFWPAPSILKFMLDPGFVRFIIGPVGSAKTTGCIMELLRRATEQAPSKSGIRATRFALVRNTFNQLRQTVLEDAIKLLGPLAVYKVQEGALVVRFALADGTLVHSKWLLTPLDRQEDARKLLSLQLTGAYLNEFREIDFKIFSHLQGRVGRFPDKLLCPTGPTWQGIIGDSNPFSVGSPWYRALVLDKPAGWSFFRQPGGMTDRAENVENLPDGYYPRMMQGHDDEWVKVHVHGDYGADMSGQAVFGNSFDESVHVTDPRRPGQPGMSPIPGKVVMVGIDFGRTPCAVFCQHDNWGRLCVMDELTSDGMGIVQFISSKLKPMVNSARWEKADLALICDPAGQYRDQVVDYTPIDALKEAGLIAVAALTDKIEPRLQALERLFMAPSNGPDGRSGAVMIDRERCPLLIRAFTYEYRYRRKKNLEIEDKPEKNHPWSDLVDACGYVALSHDTGLATRAVARSRRRLTGSRETGQPNAAGWT